MFGLFLLETLPGWEVAADPTVLEAVTLYLGIPAAIFAVILLLGLAPSWFGKDDEKAVRSDD
jgi:hypothetical protein